MYLENGTLYHNVTSQQPSFNVGRLDPATNYQIKVYVSRGQVTSQPVVVSAYTSRSSSKKDGTLLIILLFFASLAFLGGLNEYLLPPQALTHALTLRENEEKRGYSYTERKNVMGHKEG